MDRSHTDPALKKLFEESAARQSDLIQALYDPDKEVGVKAQVILNYAGDPVGLAGIEKWIAYSKKQVEDYWMPNINTVSKVRDFKGQKKNLVKLILRNGFRGEKDGWGKLIAFEPKNKCALVEIVFGETFTEGWHVVVREENGQWRWVVKTLVWQS